MMAAAGAGASKAGKTVNSVMKTPLGHVSTDIGPVHLEGNVTPWGIVAAVIGADIAITLYNGHKDQITKQGQYIAAKAFGLYYASLLDIEGSLSVQTVKVIQELQQARTPQQKRQAEERLKVMYDAITKNHERIRNAERTLSEKFPDLWSLLSGLGAMGQKQWTGGSARKNVLLYMSKMKKPKYESPSPMKALGSALGSLVTDVTKGIKSGWG